MFSADGKRTYDAATLAAAQAYESSAYISRAKKLLDDGKDEEAKAQFILALQRNPGAAKEVGEAYNDRGNAFYTKKEYDRAIADYSMAIEIDPKNASGYYDRGNAFYAKKENDRAIATARRSKSTRRMP